MNIDKLSRMQEVLEQSIEKGEIAGGNIAVIHKGKEVYYTEAGYADIANKKPIKRDSIFRLYSMTKPVTAAAVMLLVERGIIDLSEPLSKYFPEYNNMTIASDGKVMNAENQIKLKDLMNMTSGLVYGGIDDVPAGDVQHLFDDMIDRLYSDKPVTTVEFAKRLASCRIAYEPGSQWRYGTSADVLGAVIEIASGMKFGDFLQKEFFEPLGMKDTGFSVPEEKRDRLVKVYEQTTDGLTEYHFSHLAILNKMDTSVAFESGGAGLVSTIEDYQKFTQMLLNGGSFEGKEYLSKESVRFLTGARLQPWQDSYLVRKWDMLAGFSYGNLMRVCTDPSLSVFTTFKGEYGWDGWLGVYFANIPEKDCTFLMMIQRKDTGTFNLTAKLRNVLASAF